MRLWNLLMREHPSPGHGALPASGLCLVSCPPRRRSWLFPASVHLAAFLTETSPALALAVVTEDGRDHISHLPKLPQSWNPQGPRGGHPSPHLIMIPEISYCLGKEIVSHSRMPAWKITWTEEPGGLQSMGSQRVRHDWATNTHMCWAPTRLQA